MDIDICLKHLVGVPGTPASNAMVRALQLHPWNNTAEEKLRLAAALWANTHRRQVMTALQQRRDSQCGGR